MRVLLLINRRGYFSVPLKRGNQFSQITIGETTEETVNKNMQLARVGSVALLPDSRTSWCCNKAVAWESPCQDPLYFKYLCSGVHANRRINKIVKQLLLC